MRIREEKQEGFMECGGKDIEYVHFLDKKPEKKEPSIFDDKFEHLRIRLIWDIHPNWIHCAWMSVKDDLRISKNFGERYARLSYWDKVTGLTREKTTEFLNYMDVHGLANIEFYAYDFGRIYVSSKRLMDDKIRSLSEKHREARARRLATERKYRRRECQNFLVLNYYSRIGLFRQAEEGKIELDRLLTKAHDRESTRAAGEAIEDSIIASISCIIENQLVGGWSSKTWKKEDATGTGLYDFLKDNVHVV